MSNLYDLLDVAETASEPEIRAAWKAAIADLDPTERRFRAYSDAAAVLLDAERRAAYDAELAAERAAAEPDPEPEPVPESDREPAVEPVVVPPAPAPSAPPTPSTPPTPVADEANPRRVPGWLVGAVSVLAVLSLGVALWVVTLPGARADTSPRAAAQEAARVERAGLDAEGAAEQMVAPVLSYNHQTMDADLQRARTYLTKRMDTKQTAAWPDLTKEAVAQQIVVEAVASGTALTRASADGRRATVVVFIDQSVTKKDAQPFVLRMWATMELVKDADGPQGWLLDDLCTDSSCG